MPTGHDYVTVFVVNADAYLYVPVCSAITTTGTIVAVADGDDAVRLALLT